MVVGHIPEPGVLGVGAVSRVKFTSVDQDRGGKLTPNEVLIILDIVNQVVLDQLCIHLVRSHLKDRHLRGVFYVDGREHGRRICVC